METTDHVEWKMATKNASFLVGNLKNMHNDKEDTFFQGAFIIQLWGLSTSV